MTHVVVEPKPELKDLLDGVIAEHIEIYRAGFAAGVMSEKRDAQRKEYHEKARGIFERQA